MPLQRHVWNAYYRTGERDRWTWVSSGAFFTEANGAALLRAPAGAEIRVCFGGTMPGDLDRRRRSFAR